MTNNEHDMPVDSGGPAPRAASPGVRLDTLPFPLALVLDEYAREAEPFIRLWRLVDAAELLTRFVAVVLLADLLRRHRGELPEPVRAVLDDNWQFDRPTFGTWRNLIRAALDAPPEADDEPQKRAESLAAVAAAQAHVGDDAGARATLSRAADAAGAVAELRERVESLAAVAAGQARVGDDAGARATLARAADAARADADPRERAESLATVAAAQAQVGDVEGASASAGAIADPQRQAKALAAEAEARARSGDIAGAHATVGAITDPRVLSEVQVTLARTLIDRGDYLAAVQIAQLVSLKQETYLAAILDHLVKAGDRQFWRQLAPLCANSLATAYHLCGTLAQFYPQHARAIAALIVAQ